MLAVQHEQNDVALLGSLLMDLRMVCGGWIWCFEFPSVIDAVGWATGRASSL